MYGFRKVADCSDRTYSHPYFKRGCSNLLIKVRRVSPTQGRKKRVPPRAAPPSRLPEVRREVTPEEIDDDGFGGETTGESEEGDEEAPAARKKRRLGALADANDAHGGRSIEEGGCRAGSTGVANRGAKVSRLKCVMNGAVGHGGRVVVGAGVDGSTNPAIPVMSSAKKSRPSRKQARNPGGRQAKAEGKAVKSATRAGLDARTARGQQPSAHQHLQPALNQLWPTPAPQQQCLAAVSSSMSPVIGPWATPSSPSCPLHVNATPDIRPMRGLGGVSFAPMVTTACAERSPPSKSEARIISPVAPTCGGNWQKVYHPSVSSNLNPIGGSPVMVTRLPSLYNSWSESRMPEPQSGWKSKTAEGPSPIWLDKAFGFGAALAQCPSAATPLIFGSDDFVVDGGVGCGSGEVGANDGSLVHAGLGAGSRASTSVNADAARMDAPILVTPTSSPDENSIRKAEPEEEEACLESSVWELGSMSGAEWRGVEDEAGDDIPNATAGAWQELTTEEQPSISTDCEVDVRAEIHLCEQSRSTGQQSRTAQGVWGLGSGGIGEQCAHKRTSSAVSTLSLTGVDTGNSLGAGSLGGISLNPGSFGASLDWALLDPDSSLLMGTADFDENEEGDGAFGAMSGVDGIRLVVEGTTSPSSSSSSSPALTVDSGSAAVPFAHGTYSPELSPASNSPAPSTSRLGGDAFAGVSPTMVSSSSTVPGFHGSDESWGLESPESRSPLFP